MTKILFLGNLNLIIKWIYVLFLILISTHGTWPLIAVISPPYLNSSPYKVRSLIPWIYGGFYTVYYKDVGEFQILYSQDICW
jgi:hypothetical protein